MARREQRKPRKPRPERPAADTPPPRAMSDQEARKVDALIREIVELEGFETLVLTISKDRRIALTLDNPRRPVTLGSCTFMNHRIRRGLEAAGFEADNYAIEVASPGTRRPLTCAEHFERFEGEGAVLRIPGEEGKTVAIRGLIGAVREGSLTFTTTEGEELSFEIDGLSSAFLDPRVASKGEKPEAP